MIGVSGYEVGFGRGRLWINENVLVFVLMMMRKC